MTFKYEIVLTKNLSDHHRDIFAKLLKKQGKVKGNLKTKADRCKIIGVVYADDVPIAIGGIKTKTASDFSVNKANLVQLEKDFKWELGYLFTDKDFSGKGIARQLTKLLIHEYGSGNLMASTEIKANPGMVKILISNGFLQYGQPWKSGIHENYLGLFLKHK